MKTHYWLMGASIAISLALAGCKTLPENKNADSTATQQQASAPLPPPEPVKPLDPTAQKEQNLTEALNIYAEGRFDDAIVWLTPLVGAPELPLASQIKVLKFMAFSHCAMGRLKPCRQHFDMALEQDPTFQLTEAEKGHPIWGKEFNNARLAARNKRPVKK